MRTHGGQGQEVNEKIHSLGHCENPKQFTCWQGTGRAGSKVEGGWYLFWFMVSELSVHHSKGGTEKITSRRQETGQGNIERGQGKTHSKDSSSEITSSNQAHHLPFTSF